MENYPNPSQWQNPQWQNPQSPSNYPQMPNTQQGFQPSFQATPKKKSKWWIWFLVILVFLIVFALGTVYYITQTPQYSLYKMTKAVQEKNVEEVFKYFNFDSVFEDIIQKFIAQQEKEIEAQYGKEGVAQYRMFMKEEIEKQKDSLKQQAKDSLKKEIEEGKFSLTREYKISLIKSFQEVKTKKLPNGDVNVTVKNEQGKSVTFTMRKKNGYWEIYKIDMTLEELQKLFQ